MICVVREVDLMATRRIARATLQPSRLSRCVEADATHNVARSASNFSSRAGDGIRTHALPSLCQGEISRFPPPGAPKASPTLILPVPEDADLRLIVDAWPALPEPIRTGILAIVKAAKPSPIAC